MNIVSESDSERAGRLSREERLGVTDQRRKFVVYIDRKGAQEALEVLNRAVRTWEPRFWPEWLQPMFDTLEELTK